MAGGKPIPRDPVKTLEGMPALFASQFNYHTCLGLPIALRAIADHKGPPLMQGTAVKKLSDSTSRAWAVLRKKRGQAVDLDLSIALEQAQDVNLEVLGPDLRPVSGVELLLKQPGVVTPFTPGVVPYFLRARIPADWAEGEYRVGHKNPGAFTVLSATADRVVLECPEGFWLGGPTSFYFRAPSGQKTVELFAGSAVTVTRPDGSAAADPKGRRAGVLSLPVQGKGGMWRIRHDRLAYVRLLNLPPIVAYSAPDRFFLPKKLVKVAQPKRALPDPRAAFVKGVIGQALQLKSRERFRFKRGEKLKDGTFENFPGHKGTIEFWFRPNWSAVDFASATPRYMIRPIMSAGSLSMVYRCGARYMRFRATLDFYCGRSKRRGAKGRIGTYGSHARVYPKAGEWMHVAATWNTKKSLYDTSKEMRREEHFFVFVNGKRYFRRGGPGRLRHYLGKAFIDRYDLSGIAEWITLEPADGTFDELRVSDVVRYNADFTPLRTAFVRDKSTKALIHFDGSTRGQGGEGRKLETEYRDLAAWRAEERARARKR